MASYLEWRQAKSESITKEAETYQTIAEQLESAFSRVCAFAEERGVTPRVAAQAVAVEELIAAMRDRGWIPVGE